MCSIDAAFVYSVTGAGSCLMRDPFCFAAGAAPEETNQRSSSAHNRHSLTKGKFDGECDRSRLHRGTFACYNEACDLVRAH